MQVFQKTKNTLSNAYLKAGVAFTLATTASGANASVKTDADFYDYYDKVNEWATGALGVGISLTALIVGAIMGLAQSSIFPALTGLGIAAMFMILPGVIKTLVADGALLPPADVASAIPTIPGVA